MDFERAKQLQKEDLDLMYKKNQDYSGQSGDNITATGVYGVAVRLTDKVERLRNLTSPSKDGRVNYESIEDTLMDIRNYGLIGQLVGEGKWQESPKAKYVYLCGPINCIPRLEATDWREATAKILAHFGIGSFSPVGANCPGDLNRTGSIIQRIDRMAIAECDLVLANLDIISSPSAPLMFGTIREIEYAKMLGKPVIVVRPGGIISAFASDIDTMESLRGALCYITGDNLDDSLVADILKGK